MKLVSIRFQKYKLESETETGRVW